MYHGQSQQLRIMSNLTATDTSENSVAQSHSIFSTFLVMCFNRRMLTHILIRIVQPSFSRTDTALPSPAYSLDRSLYKYVRNYIVQHLIRDTPPRVDTDELLGPDRTHLGYASSS